ncbi:MAG TPA: hypothetical protein VHH34_11415 [Pseudonocardiaceae bacterium]|nr:hypothetical protein [Pseudonocardiaceae bacterium]
MITTSARARPDSHPSRKPTRRRARRHRDRQRYRRQQAQLDADALARWRAIVAHWDPLTEGQIRAIATILHRIDTHTRKDRGQTNL